MFAKARSTLLDLLSKGLHRANCCIANRDNTPLPFIVVVFFEKRVGLGIVGHPIKTFDAPLNFEQSSDHCRRSEVMQRNSLQCACRAFKVEVVAADLQVTRHGTRGSSLFRCFVNQVSRIHRDGKCSRKTVIVRLNAIQSGLRCSAFDLFVGDSEAGNDCSNGANSLNPGCPVGRTHVALSKEW